MLRPKIAVIASHPIQYFCPMYSSLARYREWEVMVYFASSVGLESHFDANFGHEVQWQGLQIDFPHTFLNSGRVVPINSALDALDLEDQLESYSPNVLILYGYTQALQRRAARWGSETGKKMLMISDSENRHPRSIARRLVKAVLLPGYYRRFHGFLTIGDANEDYYQGYGVAASRLFRMPFPIDVARFEETLRNRMERRAKVRKSLGIDPHAVVCGVVGKLVPWKRQQDLIDAIRILTKADAPVVALIIGSGKDEDALRSMARTMPTGRVTFAGFVQPMELPDYYAAMDIYAQPSSTDAYSVAVSEAVYTGLPVIISDKCGSFGPADSVQHGRNGFVYTCGEVVELSKCIDRLTTDENLRAQFAEASREFGIRAQRLAHGEGLRASLVALGMM